MKTDTVVKWLQEIKNNQQEEDNLQNMHKLSYTVSLLNNNFLCPVSQHSLQGLQSFESDNE